MQQLLVEILSLPRMVITLIFGALGGAVGFGLGLILQKAFKLKPQFAIIFAVFCIAIAIQIPKFLAPSPPKFTAYFAALNKSPVMAALSKYNPDMEVELSAKYKELTAKPKAKAVLSEEVSTSFEQIIDKYNKKHYLLAPNSVLYKQNLKELEIFKNLQQTNPKLCLDFHFKTVKPRDKESTELVNESHTMAIEVIEASVSNPTPMKEANTSDVSKLLLKGYQDKGYTVEDVRNLMKVSSLQPNEVCDTLVKYKEVLASMNEQDFSLVKKSTVKPKSNQ